jgi:hypothetical protein
VTSPSGTPILFTVTGANPQVKLVDANSSGSASFSYSALHPGADTVTASATVASSALTSNPVTLTWVAGKDTSFVSLDGSQEIGPVGQPATFTASLSDISQTPSAPVSGATIPVTVGAQSCTITTGTTGSGTCQIIPSTGGVLPVSATYAGSGTLTASTAASSFFAGGPSTTPPPVAPAITSGASDTVTAGAAFNYPVTTTGSPTPAITLASGSSLPTGVTLTDNGNGTATLAGTSSAAAGTYKFTIQAANGVSPNATQAFTLTVNPASAQASLKFTGALSYVNSGSLTSGGFTIKRTDGTIQAVTGTGTIKGLKGGAATITVNIQHTWVFFFGRRLLYVGTISVNDPRAHLNTTALVLTPTLARIGTTGVSGIAYGLAPNLKGIVYVLNWTI